MKKRAVLLLVGAGMATYGAVGLFGSAHRRALISAGEWFVGGAVLHDALLAPAVVGLGVVLTRLVPGAVRPYAQAGLIVSGALLLVATPLLTGLGYQRRNPSALPLDYGRGTAIAIGCVWGCVSVTAAVTAVVTTVQRKRRGGSRR